MIRFSDYLIETGSITVNSDIGELGGLFKLLPVPYSSKAISSMMDSLKNYSRQKIPMADVILKNRVLDALIIKKGSITSTTVRNDNSNSEEQITSNNAAKPNGGFRLFCLVIPVVPVSYTHLKIRHLYVCFGLLLN